MHCLVPSDIISEAKVSLHIEHKGLRVTTIYHLESLKHHSPKINETLLMREIDSVTISFYTYSQYKFYLTVSMV